MMLSNISSIVRHKKIKINILKNTHYYSTIQKPTEKDISTRLVAALKRVPKINGELITPKSHFYKDLNLDSLEKTEALLAIEDEFAIEIPDAESSLLHSCEDVIQYLSNHRHVK